MILLPLNFILFPYTTLFRSEGITTLMLLFSYHQFWYGLLCTMTANTPGWAPYIYLTLLGLGYGGAMLTRLMGLLNSADRKSTRLNSSHQIISYAVFCLKKKK